MPAAFLACMAVVSAFYQLPPRVLPSIQAVEGGRPGLVSANSNGSEDLGVMQVNTLWIAPLARDTGRPEAEVRARLIDEPCFNIAAAGAILRIELDASDGDLLRAVGNYHSRTPALHEAYRGRVLAAAERLFGAAERSAPPPPPPFEHDQSHR
ncbi:lytic transglycosylase domain-containing protein [Marinibaculum pumilum]|uniref:Lytic transglycosylase domain-containing protein n=1 Tax=Marinibaculum pumilum TaxID=1766165 RepID=A0ABV7L0X7_9PROT